MNYYSILMKDRLSRELYLHSLGAAEAAVGLARQYGADESKAYLAGMVHDYGKRYSGSELLQKADLHGVPLDRWTRQSNKLLHAPVGAALLKIELEIDDPEIISAVAYHTTGRSGMSLLEKIVYLADYIEAGRLYDGVENVRNIALKNLDQALLLAVDTAIRSVVDRKLLLHPQSVAFRNSLICEDLS